jgi:anti-anti-sigma factor
MPEDFYPVNWTGQQAVVALPEQIDVANAGQIREELLAVINRGAAALIADMTATISCDHAGADALVRAYRRAVLNGSELRLVVTARIVARVLSLSGLDRLVSIYPSREAATAARTPPRAAAAVPAQAAAREPARAAGRAPAGAVPAAPWPAGTGSEGEEPPGRGGRAAAHPAAAAPGAGGAAIAPAVAWKVLDALQDGVALADGNGAVALANLRLEQMFGYEHAELLGHPVESLVPAGLQAAQSSHQAVSGRPPRPRPACAGAHLVGLRKDGTTFPVEITLSPVATAAGQFALTMIRDVTGAEDGADRAGFARTAVTDVHDDDGRELLDSIVTSLFHLGLSLQAAIDLPADSARQRIGDAIRRVDDTIREIRDAGIGRQHSFSL